MDCSLSLKYWKSQASFYMIWGSLSRSYELDADVLEWNYLAYVIQKVILEQGLQRKVLWTTFMVRWKLCCLLSAGLYVCCQDLFPAGNCLEVHRLKPVENHLSRFLIQVCWSSNLQRKYTIFNMNISEIISLLKPLFLRYQITCKTTRWWIHWMHPRACQQNSSCKCFLG